MCSDSTLCLQEAFDYIGSGRMVYDMSRGEFPKSLKPGDPGPQPVGLEKLRAMLEVSQLGVDAPVWMHSDPVWAQKDPNVTNMVSIAETRINFNPGMGMWLHPFPDIKVHGANTGPTWDRQDPGRPHVGPMKLAIWVLSVGLNY